MWVIALKWLCARWRGRGREGQVFVDEGDRNAAFPDAAGDAFDGAVTNVAGAEDAGDAGFEGEGLAVEGPGGEVATGADVAAGVALDPGWQPVGLGDSTDHDE